MPQAKTIPAEQVQAVVERVTAVGQRPVQDALIFTMSFRQGLRACEMAGVKWKDVIDASGELVRPGQFWELPNGISKKGAGGRLPMHKDFFEALVRAKAEMPAEATAPNKTIVLRARRDGSIDPALTPSNPDALRKHVQRTFAAAGLNGCTSHSGRRTFITTLARRATNFKCSLRDVQKLARHKDITTTELYVDLSDGVADLVGSL